MPVPAHLRTYGDRAENATNLTAKLLLQTMERKKTNLAVSVDVTTSDDFLSILVAVGPYVCLIKASIPNRLAERIVYPDYYLKTHIDIIEDFHPSLIEQMNLLCQKYDFLFFEDRKFADIG
jgi:orotidine-5'-phosphate decarboxylase